MHAEAERSDEKRLREIDPMIQGPLSIKGKHNSRHALVVHWKRGTADGAVSEQTELARQKSCLYSEAACCAVICSCMYLLTIFAGRSQALHYTADSQLTGLQKRMRNE